MGQTVIRMVEEGELTSGTPIRNPVRSVRLVRFVQESYWSAKILLVDSGIEVGSFSSNPATTAKILESVNPNLCPEAMKTYQTSAEHPPFASP